jgi:hypothetical protein
MSTQDKLSTGQPTYYLTHPDFGTKKVTREEWIAEESRQGFRSKFGPGHPATGGFSAGGVSGSIRYEVVEEDEAPSSPSE